ncbi:general transcription factor II-I repeat domain-containing protein 2-like [Nylanderia fulva]|uniref:general transcription factor II-I repeat domain-containing protein 2-like n=1 Tax=Nylanderia fulva TaxID=613905 RepID=UPI0010FB4DBD|nr:general transcription factor II-I repeat domain-containing protein 2-like [Nylanderia fulva]XP_029176460.1 general transcription factor II-I repeat domain-containing protein 2-like [Nylanderia fulva]
MADGSKQNYEQRYDRIWEDIFFVFVRNRTTCVLCGYEPSVVKRYNLKRHYRVKHSGQYSSYTSEEKLKILEGLKLVYQADNSSDLLISNAGNNNAKALAASYAISFLIAKHSKSFSDGEFIKNCLVETVKSFDGKLTVDEVTSIPLSHQTVGRRITNIALSIEDRLKSLLATCSYFSLCLDESTDNRHVSQLSIFIRIVQNDFSCVEELLDFVALHDTTMGIDIFRAVEKTLNKFNLDFTKCSSIITDGTKAMTGSKNGFLGQIRQRDLKFPMIHCIIHQEALCGKTVKLSSAMQTVTQIVNFIKGGHKFLSHRKFQHFLEEHNATYTDLPLYCEVRWLSAGKCLEKFFAIRKEIFLFLQEISVAKCDEYKFFLEDLEFLSELAFITDLTNHLNILNLKLQRPNQVISQLVSAIDSFRRQLLLFKNHIVTDNLHFFPSCQVLFEEHGKSCNFQKHLQLIDSLISQFNTRFSDFEMLRNDLILLENPFTAQIEEQNIELQQELCDLQSELSLKTRPEKGIEVFKILDVATYPRLRNFGLRFFSMFGSTYLCECSFSKMKYIKTDRRSCLKDASLSSLMRISTSNIEIDVPSVIESYERRSRTKF